jgi:hypothetical protein
MRWRLYGLGLLWCCAAWPVAATEIVVIREATIIPPGQSRHFEFGTVAQRDKTVLLEIAARVNAERPSGSNYLLKMSLNSEVIQPARARGLLRLLNKPLIAPVAANLPAPWFGNHAFRLVYAPDFSAAARLSFYQGDPYSLVLDVTDLVNPLAENRLELTNLLQPGRLALPPPAGNLVVGRLVIRTRPQPSPMMTAVANAGPIINLGAPAAGPARYAGRLLPGGGFRITVGSRQWEFASEFSYPRAGLNRLAPRDAVDTIGQRGWTVRTLPSPTGGEVLAQGPDYRLRRTVRFTPRKVEIADMLTNAHADAPLGMLVRHQTSLAGLKDPIVRLAGNADPAVSDYYSPANPSIHVACGAQALGLLAEDDVLRNQAHLFCNQDPPAAGLRTEMLWLGPGESYTLRWSVYPVAGPDYYDFINLVRDDWGANRTVDGAWTFFHPDSILALPAEEIRRQFQRLGIRYACYCGGWVDGHRDRKRIGFGAGVLDDYWADFRRRLREAAAKIHRAAPGVKVLVYYDTQRDTSEGSPQRFRDSWLTDPQGRQVATDWSGLYSHTWSMVATLDNSFGRAMLEAADRYLNEMRIDGLYWDEMENVTYGAPLLTYSRGDGHSCLLDLKNYTIQREVGITALLGEAHRLAVIDRVRRRGGAVMGNGPPHTRAMLESGVPRMVEIQHNEYFCFEGNLATPLGYMGSRSDFGNFARALAMPCLPVGTRADYAFDISRHLFPLTPIELHHGYTLGRERIVALHSGRYGWSGQRCLVQAWAYHADGTPAEADAVTYVAAEARTEVRLSPQEAIVLEQLPATLEPHYGAAEVRDVHYDGHCLTLRVSAPQGGTLTLAPGMLGPGVDSKLVVQSGTEPPRAIAAGNGPVHFTIPAGQALGVKIQGR